MKKPRLGNSVLRLLVLGGLSALCFLNASAQIQRYSVFKNGQAFVFSIDSLKAENGKSHLTLPQDVLFGTLWIGSSTGAIDAISSVPGNLSTTRKLQTLREMLANNTGKRVRLILAYQDPQEAVVSSVLENVAVFKTKDRWITTGIDKIETIEFLDEPVLTEQEKGQLLEIKWAGKPVGDQAVSAIYMRNNLGWMPEYLVILGNENTATVSLRAKLINDAEDIKNADIDFVAGVPNFKYGNVTDPLSNGRSFDELMALLGNSGDANPGKYTLFMNKAGDGNMQQPAPDGTTLFAEGEASEDFYYYSLKGLTLPKGGRATYPLLNGQVNMRHIFAGTIPTNVLYFPVYSGDSHPKDRETTVYHSIELTNSTGQPWTSGSAFVVRGDGGGQTDPMAQDLMPYTSPGGKAEVKITSTPEIHVTDTEEEKDREEDAKEENKISYDMITVEGKISVQNNKDESVTLELSRAITGTLVRSDVAWTFTKDVNVNNAMNPQNQVKWEILLKSGEKRTVTYRYKILVAKQ